MHRPLLLGGVIIALLALIFALGCDTSGSGSTASVVDCKILDDGTWLVYTATGLQEWATEVKSNNNLKCTLGVVIDMEGESWTPMYNYKGMFDGGDTMSIDLFGGIGDP